MNLIDLLWTFLISASPVVELRGAIPIAINNYDIAWYIAFPVCFVGNLIPVPFLLLFLDPVARLASRIGPIKTFLDWVFRRTHRQGRLVEKYKRIGLLLFVAIPLPGTGAWTGSILAFLLGIKLKSSFISIIAGVFIAGLIVTALTLLGWVGIVIAGVGLLTLAALGIWRI
ncbi:COG2426 family protein [Chloroflexota bacterium]